MGKTNITVGLVIPRTQGEKIRKAADRGGMTVSDFLRAIISRHVPGLGDLTPRRPRKRYAVRKLPASGKKRIPSQMP